MGRRWPASQRPALGSDCLARHGVSKKRSRVGESTAQAHRADAGRSSAAVGRAACHCSGCCGVVAKHTGPASRGVASSGIPFSNVDRRAHGHRHAYQAAAYQLHAIGNGHPIGDRIAHTDRPATANTGANGHLVLCHSGQPNADSDPGIAGSRALSGILRWAWADEYSADRHRRL
jgi:hypothetical protein